MERRAYKQARFAVRDLINLLVPPDEAKRRQAQAAQATQEQQQQTGELTAATIRKTLAEAFKNVTQGQKNVTAADAATISAALDVLEKGLPSEVIQNGAGGAGDGGSQKSRVN